ncbi:ABC transporter ATP-binding protein [Chromohalobacter japonicus]|uniref:ABC transporter ATP-binding protein n=1 Tax=Chromohalobacter japonicus TaxID=223900 RepID=A0A1Q8TI04_9GAMM|nr:ATP-binding cassette domain-containing protein [Chromohalobacter japonicus]OLO13268.1 ABC transporter ATP-binding protein [Chromohalobacter japonicus]
MLKLKNVGVSIDGVQVLRDVNFEMPQGKVTVLVGRNGAGKTTTLRSIMGLLKCDNGQVLLDENDLTKVPAQDRARLGIGYAPEDRRLIGNFSVEENILLPALALKMTADERERKLSEVYELLPELYKLRGRPGSGVSGGQGKMVALGRALMISTNALLLDEPFQGLAPALALEYARTLGKLRDLKNNLSFLITESSPNLLKGIGDYTLIIDRGNISRNTSS